MRYLASPRIYTCSNKGLLHNGLLVLDDQNKLEAILENEQIDSVPKDKIECFAGALVPGFVNAHCHLELSYLKNKIPEKKGLDGFIKAIELHKSDVIELIEQAAYDADAAMYRNGIVAVGDICNTAHTVSVKNKSALYYHNFIETYAFNPGKANTVFNQAQIIQQTYLNNNLVASITPHAPYSVSYELFKLIDTMNANIISMHNQESEAENTLFQSKSGKLLDRLNYFGIPTNHFKATGLNALASVIPYLNPQHVFILVHNTVSTAIDIEWMNNYANHVYWCFCPKANLYIENQLPNYELFKSNHCKITIGTDSLASNNSLDIQDEIKTILRHNKHYDLSDLIEAACINGAKALKIDNKYGSFEIGKQPGVNEWQLEDNGIKKIV
jgi:aminodeoxyfutalosine deaminase